VIAIFDAGNFGDLFDAFAFQTDHVHSQDRVIVKRGELGGCILD